jgi:hypothetical protein
MSKSITRSVRYSPEHKEKIEEVGCTLQDIVDKVMMLIDEKGVKGAIDVIDAARAEAELKRLRR